MDSTGIASSIRRFIIDNFPAAARRELSDTDMLLESGIVDSTGVLELIGFLESEFKLAVNDDELIPENFQTIECMTT